MRSIGVILGATALLVVVVGITAIVRNLPDDDQPATVTPADVPLPSSSGRPEPNPETVTPESGSSETPAAASMTPIASPTPAIEQVNVQQPRLELPTFPLASVEATYTEAHQFGLISVRFRPGAFSFAHAEDVARMTEEARIEANAKLGTAWSDTLTVFLADQLFAADCLGCQGFTESDFRWIFMLDDGSVVQDEFEALLVHEMTHLIAGNEIHLPFDTFYVEGLATWVMTDDLDRFGYVSPLQSTAWIFGQDALPSLEDIMSDNFAGANEETCLL